jgi:hypothetical protein
LLNTRTAKEAEKLHFWVDQFSGEAQYKEGKKKSTVHTGGGKAPSSGEGVRLVERTSGCAFNGRDLPSEISDKILRLWVKYGGEPITTGERITYIFDLIKDGKESGNSSRPY